MSTKPGVNGSNADGDSDSCLRRVMIGTCVVRSAGHGRQQDARAYPWGSILSADNAVRQRWKREMSSFGLTVLKCFLATDNAFFLLHARVRGLEAREVRPATVWSSTCLLYLGVLNMHTGTTIAGLALLGSLTFVSSAICQDRDGDRNHYGGDRITRIEPGTNISVRTNDSIDVERFDKRVYYGVVDQDVRGQNGRLAIPRGSRVELIVRVMRDNDLVLDLESVNVNGERYAIQTDTNRVESQHDNSLVGTILGAINGGQMQGRAVRIPRDSVLNFRIETPLFIGVTDRGIDRGGKHYHDWYKQNDYYYRENR